MMMMMMMMAELEGNNVNVTSMGPNGWWDVPMYNEQCGFTTGQYPHPIFFPLSFLTL